MESKKKKPLKVVKLAREESNNVKEPQISLVKASMLTDEEKAVINSLRRISINARRKAYKRKSAVTIIRNGRILRVHSNRKVKSVGVVKKIEIVVDINKPIRIK
jgi:hypothetical protein